MFFVICICVNCCINMQMVLFVFIGVWFMFCFLEVFYGDYVDQVEFVINYQCFFNVFFVYFCQYYFMGFIFMYGDQMFFWCYVNVNWLVQVGNKMYVMIGDNIYQFVFFGNDWIVCKIVMFGQFFYFVQCCGWQNSLWISYYIRFVFFYMVNFFCLVFNGYVFVDKVDIVFLSQSNSQVCFCYGIYCCGKYRDIQMNSFCQLGVEVSSIWQNGRVSRNEENVVKCQSFFSDMQYG